MARKLLPIGRDYFDKLRRDDCYYVDKTLLIRDLLDIGAEVTLFTRPRRFGKTLMMTMLKAFFEKTEEDTTELFRGLAIEGAGDKYWQHHKSSPVVFLSLKGIEGTSFDFALGKLSDLIAAEAERHPELRDSPMLSVDERAAYRQLCAGTDSAQKLSSSLFQLSIMLEKHHREKVVILIDEYDVPLDRAYLNGYYEPMISLMRVFLGDALKSNPSLRFAVLTGCLRITRESIFTGLNNLQVHSLLNVRFRDSFGFTRDEVAQLLADYGAPDRLDDAREWYDGYNFGGIEMYNPWDLLNFTSQLMVVPDARPESFWINTSGNDFIQRFIASADSYTKDDIERLVAGETVTKTIRAELTYGDLDADPNNLWSLLLLTGYLTPVGRVQPGEPIELRIPNAEIRQIFVEKIMMWLKTYVAARDLRPLYQALLDGDAAQLEKRLRALLLDSISYHDSRESFYHGFLVGILHGTEQWRMASNREAGHGRADILLEGRDYGQADIIEIKVVHSARDLDAACEAAIAQIREREYAHPLMERGYETIRLYGIAFCGKICRVRCEVA